MRSDDVIAGRYRLVELIGHGGMGIVWLADDLVEHRQVAVKRPHGGGSVRADLEREAEIARRVEHPGAIEVYEVAGEGDDCWLIMEYFPSRSLAAAGTLDPGAVADIGAQVAAALAAAHAADVVHRDVTPANVLVGADGAVKVTDFGISAWRAATITGSGKISGTAAYVSPEVADGAAAKAPSDVFSLGATLFNAVEGTPPFGSGDPDVILTRIRANRREPMTKAGPLAPVLDALLQRERAARPTASQAKEMLELVAAGRPVPAWRPPVTGGRRPAMVAGAAVGVVALLALALLRPWEGDGQGPARTVLGDPHTADPCALMSAESLAGFGDATLDADYGGFNRCDVVVDLGDRFDADVRVELRSGDAGGEEVERGPAERDDDSCDITFTLTDGNLVEVVAKADEGADANLCAMATAAADKAESVLRVNDEIPRRPAAVAGSLLDVDACMLLTPADLRELPGFANAEPVRGFGNWDCRWPDTHGTAAARVIFDKGDADSVRGGVHSTLAGRDVYLKEEDFGEDTCQADVVNREYRAADGDLLAEVAMVVVEGDPDVAELCRMATTLAGPVASRLPR
ncbi:serine/threonine-protein kinase [Actinophytocola sp. KF-1]